MDVAITTEDVRGATILAMEGFWHPDAGADFDRWLAGVKAEAIRELAGRVAIENPGVSKVTAENWARWIRSHADRTSPDAVPTEEA